MRCSLTRSIRCALIVLCTCALISGGVPLPAGAALPDPLLADVWVSVTGNDSTGDGSEALPFRTISHALLRVDDVATVHVMPGTYHTGEIFPIIVRPRTMIESTGGKWVTTIQGDGAHSVISMRHPLEHTGVRGFAITGGSSGLGGGVEMIADVLDTPESNWPRITDCDILGNNGPAGAGGGLFVLGNPGKIVTPIIEDVRIFDNTALIGGGVCAAANTMAVFQRCELRSNEADDMGGNVYLVDSNTMFYTCSITDGSSEFGGNVNIQDSGSPEFVNCSISGGYATMDGGGVNMDKTSGDVMFRGVSISDNEAIGSGGGVKGTSIVGPTSMEFVNCLIEGNVSGDLGGGVYFFSQEADEFAFESCTIADNEGDIVDGIFVNDQVSGFPVTITNCVFWHRQHTPGDNTSVEDYSGFDATDDVISYSIFRNPNITGTSVVHGDPLFIEPATRNYHVQAGSPAIDSGTTLPWPSTVDLDLEPRPLDGDSSGVAQFDMGCYERAPAVADRLAGLTRYETACEVADRGFYGATAAVLVSGAGFADALSAAGLAGVVDGPVLLVKQTSVPDTVFDMLSELAVEEVIIVGGEAVVGPEVVAALEAEGYAVKRVWGANRYDTSAEVAREMKRMQGVLFNDNALIARGDDYPDALAVGPLAYAAKAPVLLVKPTSLPSAISDVMADVAVEGVIVAGGTIAVSPEVYNELAAQPSVGEIERVYGADRYATAVAVATEGISRTWVNAGYVGVATGLNFPDALAGGPAAGNRGGVLLLCKTASLPAAPTTFLTTHKDEVLRADVFGGPDVVTSAVQQAIENALDW